MSIFTFYFGVIDENFNAPYLDENSDHNTTWVLL